MRNLQERSLVFTSFHLFPFDASVSCSPFLNCLCPIRCPSRFLCFPFFCSSPLIVGLYGSQLMTVFSLKSARNMVRGSCILLDLYSLLDR